MKASARIRTTRSASAASAHRSIVMDRYPRTTSRLSGRVDDRLRPIVPTPRHPMPAQVYPTDPPVDAVEGHVVRGAGEYPPSHLGQLDARLTVYRTLRRFGHQQRYGRL